MLYMGRFGFFLLYMCGDFMEHMFIPSLAFIGLCFTLTVLCRIPYAFAPLFSLTLLCVGGFFTAIYGDMHFFMQMLQYAGLLFFAPALYVYVRRERQKGGTPDILSALHVVMQLFTAWYFYAAKIRYFDEFYWASLAKAIFYDNSLLHTGSLIMESMVPKVHPPFAALLQVFFSLSPWGEQSYAEGAIGIAGFTVLLAFFAVIVALCRKHMPLFHAFLVATLVACIARCMGTQFKYGTYVMGYIEYYQAALLGLGLCVLGFMERSRLQTCVLFCTVVLLTGTKATSFLFAFCIVSISFLLNVVDYKMQHGKIFSLQIKDIFMLCKLPMLLFLGIVCTRLVWTVYLADVMQASAAMPILDTMPAEQVLRDATLMPQRIRTVGWDVLQVWLWAFFVLPVVFSSWLSEEFMSVFFTISPMLVAIVGAFFGMRAYMRICVPVRHVLVLCTLFIGTLLWFFLRIFIAVHMHSQHEIYTAGSYSRYIGAFFSCFIIYALVLLYTQMATRFAQYKKIFTMLLVGHTVAMLFILGFTPWTPPRAVPLPQEREAMAEVAAYLEQHTPPRSRIWFICQEKDRVKVATLRFLLQPQRYTDLNLPWNIATDDGILDIDALQNRIVQKNVDYIVIWSEGKNIRYKKDGLVQESNTQSALITL